MRLLWRAWVPLPVSALALSSIRGSAKKSAAASAASRTATAGMRAWISRGFLRGGAGTGGDGLFAGRQLGGEVPLVQAIYNELRTITDPEAEAKRGADGPVISKVLRLMDKLEPSDLGVAEDELRNLRHPLCVPVVAGKSEDSFEITMFVLPKGGGIPLHDHPNMAVLSKVLFGNLDIDSYDVASASGYGDDATESASPAPPSNHTTAPTAAAAGRRLAVPRRRSVVSAGTPSFLLTPSAGNVHAFKAPSACAVFDVLIPPYDDSLGRTCSYYRVETPSPSEDPPPQNSPTGSQKDGDAGTEGVAERTGGTAGGDARRVVLAEIPEPNGLPRWSPYRGRAVELW